MTLISTMKLTTMAVSPCYTRREAGDPSVASPSVFVGALSACPQFAATDRCPPPEGIMMTWAPAGVLHHHWAEADEGAAEHETCLFPRRHHREEGKEGPTYCGCFNAWSVWLVKMNSGVFALVVWSILAGVKAFNLAWAKKPDRVCLKRKLSVCFSSSLWCRLFPA